MSAVKLIRTHDGLLGLDFDPARKQVILCENQMEVVRTMHANFQDPDLPVEKIAKDVATAIDAMAQTGDTVAEFGVLGGFMYTTAEPDYEF